jgi:hypothetical protein
MRGVAGNHLNLFKKALISVAWHDRWRRQPTGKTPKQTLLLKKIRFETSIFTDFVNSLTIAKAAWSFLRGVETLRCSARRSAHTLQPSGGPIPIVTDETRADTAHGLSAQDNSAG